MPGELLALRVDSIQLREEHWVADLLGKAGHIRTVPIPRWVWANFRVAMRFDYGLAKYKQGMISLIRSAVEHRVTFFDTAEAYGPFTNEELAGEALAPFRGQVVIASKFGWRIDSKAERGLAGLDSRAEHIKRVAEASLKLVKVDVIDLLC